MNYTVAKIPRARNVTLEKTNPLVPAKVFAALKTLNATPKAIRLA
jgi:hypothetical protein